MITEIISTLAAQRASGDSITVTDIFRLIDDLDQDLRAVCDWAVPAICTKSEWNRALAREKRNRTLIEIFGAVPTDAMDFVERYSAAKLVTIYFDGRITMVPPDRADIEHVERSRWARLCRIAAEKLNLDYSRVAMDDACDEYFEREQAARRVKVMSAISHNPAAKFDWLALAQATCAVDNLHFAAAMMQHFMWQVKRKEAALPMGLSGFPCVAGHNGQQGVPLCHDAKNLPYRMSFSISFWRAALPVPPSSRAVCSIR